MERPVVALVKGPVGPSAEQITRMVDQAVDHLGGMERFVKPGDYVTIKGNFFAPYPPPVIVDRRVVSALIRAVRRGQPGGAVRGGERRHKAGPGPKHQLRPG